MMFFVNAVIIFITLMNIIVYYLRQREEKNYDRERKNSSSVLLDHYSCRRFSLREIKSATRNFDEALVIGKGGFGKVYKGIIDDGASTVAIKRLDFGSKQGAPQFRAEIEMLSKFRHGHLVTLIGYCNQHDEMIIVYQYMAGGSLESRLHKRHRLGGDNNSSLSWVQRLKVCIGAARGLNYLHTGTSIQDRVIHRDVKSSNILLDENMEAKISDFGLSKIGPANQTCTHVSTHVRGTRGYLDPDYILTRRVTRKSDVYAFGVVLLETLCGRPAVNLRLDEEQWGLAFWAKQCIKEGRLLDIVDSNISGSIVSKCLKVFAEIAEQCLHNSSKRRPTMAEVVTRLEYALALQEGNALYGVEADVISDTHGYGDQDGADLSTVTEASNGVGGMSTEGEVINADNEQIVESRQLGDSSHSQPNIKPSKKRSIMKKVRLFFSTKPQVFSAEDLHLGQLKRYSFRELQVATRNFSDTSYLGGGSFGNVYKGCLVDGSLVAVRRLQKELTQFTELQFQAEVEKLGMAMHRNVLQLRGFCMTPTERLLVYPYMANNNVASYLRERTEWRSPLSWQTRKQIAIGSARGLAYLHDDCVPMIIHRNVKAANMLLDEEFEVVIGHFGFAKFMDNDDTHVTTDVMGTYGYIAPEYFSTGKCSQKADVYGYGVMLLELITGQKATDTDIMLVVWANELVRQKDLTRMVDVGLQENYAAEEVEQLVQLALLCTQRLPTKRPRMSEVVRMLHGDGLAERWDEWQNEETEFLSHTD